MTRSRMSHAARDRFARQRRAEAQERQLGALELGVAQLNQSLAEALTIEKGRQAGQLSDEECEAMYRRLEALCDAFERLHPLRGRPAPVTMTS